MIHTDHEVEGTIGVEHAERIAAHHVEHRLRRPAQQEDDGDCQQQLDDLYQQHFTITEVNSDLMTCTKNTFVITTVSNNFAPTTFYHYHSQQQLDDLHQHDSRQQHHYHYNSQ